MDSLIKKYESLGYSLNYRDGDRFASLYKDFGNSDSVVNGSEQLQIGEAVDLHEGSITKKPFYKRGYLWASSAEIVSKKGNVYQYG